MILFMSLLLIVISLVIFAVFILGLGGGIFTIIFSDVIVCIVLIVLLMRFLFKK